jgi:uncharacterized membrane protein YbhN (UPF0104 family)
MNPAVTTAAHRARRLAGPIVSAVSLSAVVWWVLRQQAPHWPSTVSSELLLALAVFVYAGVTAVRGVRWHAILHGAGIPASMADTQALVIVGYMGNTVLPARGGELLRMYFMGERTGCSWISILGTIVAERVLDILALSAMLLALALATAGGTRSSFVLCLTAATAMLVLALSLVATRRLSHTERLGGRLASFTLASRNLLSAQGWMLLLLTSIVWVGEGCLYWLVGQALEIHLSLLGACFLVAISSLAAAIPAAPGYVGTYDASIQLGLRALRVSGGQAVAFGLFVRLVIFVPITLVGLILVVFRYGGRVSLARLRGARASAALELARAARPAAEPPTVPVPATTVADGRSLVGPPATSVSDLAEAMK